MGKIKTHKATAKRFSITKNGKVKFAHMNRRHQVNLKASKRMRQLRRSSYLYETFAATIIKKLMPYA